MPNLVPIQFWNINEWTDLAGCWCFPITTYGYSSSTFGVNASEPLPLSGFAFHDTPLLYNKVYSPDGWVYSFSNDFSGYLFGYNKNDYAVNNVVYQTYRMSFAQHSLTISATTYTPEVIRRDSANHSLTLQASASGVVSKPEIVPLPTTCSGGLGVNVGGVLLVFPITASVTSYINVDITFLSATYYVVG